ncbi:MAG TPA: hypothetical protein VN150_09180 [Ochrobactrum sp.]|nr:hypothetical protein [Ochrobactrum sp.]
MNIVTQIGTRAIIHLPFGREGKGFFSPTRSTTLSTNELKRIVAAMIG